MTKGAGGVIAWCLCGLTILIAGARLALAILDPASSDSSGGPTVPGGGVPVAAFETLVLVMLAVIGAVVASRQPSNAVGWILCVIPLSLGLLLLGSHGFWSLALRESPPGQTAVLIAWVSSWVWVPAMIPTLTLFPLLFPTGRPPTPRWRPVGWLSTATVVVVLVSEALRPGRLTEFPVDNPFGVSGVEAVTAPLGGGLMVVTTLASLASLVVRFRRSHRDERQQVKWVVVAALLFVLIFALAAVVQNALGEEDLGFAFFFLGWLIIASAVAVAMLRYRLYDIDVVINRALVYSSLTAILAGTYLGSVLLLQLLLERFTAGSGLAVAASTLATAALVRPARARIQSVVDRRFFRSKYDAARTLAQFGARVRQEVDLDALTAELRAVVAETMQPSHLSLWTRERLG